MFSRLFSMTVGASLAMIALEGTAVAAVPWLDAPVASPSVADTAVPAAQRPCAASDLLITVGQHGARHGQATQEIRLANRGPDACYLAGAPSIELESSGSARQMVTLSDAMATRQSQSRDRIDLSPGDAAVVLVGAPGSCDAAAGARRQVTNRLRLSFVGGGVAAVTGAHVDTLCGAAHVIDAQRADVESAQAAAGLQENLGTAGHWGRLSGRVTIPDAAVRGSTMHYTVTLSNPQDAPLPLAPCPSYTQSLHTESATVSRSFRLNCAAAGGEIPANGSVTFEMEAIVPSSMTGEGIKLSWQLQDGVAVGAIAPLR